MNEYGYKSIQAVMICLVILFCLCLVGSCTGKVLELESVDVK